MGFSVAAALAEFVAMALIVIVGNGSAIGAASVPGLVLQEALAFGLATTALLYSLAHYGAGHLNCAVTLSLVLAGHCGRSQALANLAGQLLGSLAGAAALCAIFPAAEDWTGRLAANAVEEGYSAQNALVGEFTMTLFVAFVFLEAICSSKSAANRAQACLAVGFAVFVAHAVLTPVDGCSVNPTRSFGPAAVAWVRYSAWEPWRDMWIFWAGPMLGAIAAACLHALLLRRAERDPPQGEKDEEDWDSSPVMAIPGTPHGAAPAAAAAPLAAAVPLPVVAPAYALTSQRGLPERCQDAPAVSATLQR